MTKSRTEFLQLDRRQQDRAAPAQGLGLAIPRASSQGREARNKHLNVRPQCVSSLTGACRRSELRTWAHAFLVSDNIARWCRYQSESVGQPRRSAEEAPPGFWRSSRDACVVG